MEPIGCFTRPKGEHVIVHRCLTCGFERYNRIAADDDFDLVLRLPEVQPRGGPKGATSEDLAQSERPFGGASRGSDRTDSA